MSVNAKPLKGILEGPADYNAITPPSSKELNAPVKEYPASSKIGKSPDKGLIEGPCDGKRGFGGYHHK